MEIDNGGEPIIRQLLIQIGEDPDREGLRETPARVMRAWREWTAGYAIDPATILKSFEDGAPKLRSISDEEATHFKRAWSAVQDGIQRFERGRDPFNELVIVSNIPFVSKCEHHLADIVGIAHVGYIPSGRIVGLSKLARLVDCFAKRLQVQERATTQIADAMEEHLSQIGVGVLIRASHACMSTRGVKVHNSVTTTSAMRGALMNSGDARKEFLDLCMMAEKDR